MTAFDVDKLVGHDMSTNNRSNVWVTLFLVCYFPTASFVLLAMTMLGFKQLTALGTLAILGLGLGLPWYLRRKFNWAWKKRSITAFSMLGTCGLLFAFSLGSVISETVSYNDSSSSLSSMSSTSETSNTETETSNTHTIGEQFQVGYTQYKVLSKKWQRQLGNEYFGSTADGRYLLVRIQVKNLDREERMVPQFTLVDETGAEYKESSDSMYLGKEAPLLKSLNPSVQTKLTALFDVPPEHQYTLKLSGGYWSGDEAYVKLN